MASKPVPAAFTGFRRLGSSTYLYRPPSTQESNSPRNQADPDLILLHTWLSADPRHIAKYISGYKKLYPSSHILILTTALPDATYASRASQLLRIGPVLSILKSSPPGTKILLHLFSNGGAFTSCLVAQEYKKATGKALPISSLILDSSPSYPWHWRTYTALALSLPQSPRILYYLLAGTLHIFLLLYRLSKIITWSDDLVTELRRDLNLGQYFALNVKRLYIYSKEDKMVWWEDVVDHAVEAKEKGYKVQTELWSGSGHCGHLMIDEKRYWNVVKSLWDARD
jgi:hypothetical protein